MSVARLVLLALLAAAHWAAGPAWGVLPASAQCTNAGNCSGHATGVALNATTGACDCSCFGGYRGAECGTCPIEFNQAHCYGCNAPDYAGTFPHCSRRCTNTANCSGNAESVTGTDATGCTCKCNTLTAWTGPTCDVCPAGYDADTCASCAPHHGPAFPTCRALCTVSGNCTGGAARALGVSGFANETCTCRCKNHWTEPECAACPAPFTGADCDRCEAGYQTLGQAPWCVKCTLALNCSGNAQSAVYNLTTNVCECRCLAGTHWTGPQCEVCPENYDPRFACVACAATFSGPDCDRNCTTGNSCNGHALNVSGTYNSGCSCLRCRKSWTGRSCQLCPERYDASKDCGACSFDRVDDYPNCSAIPTPEPTPVPPTPAPRGSSESAVDSSAAPSAPNASEPDDGSSAASSHARSSRRASSDDLSSAASSAAPSSSASSSSDTNNTNTSTPTPTMTRLPTPTPSSTATRAPTPTRTATPSWTGTASPSPSLTFCPTTPAACTNASNNTLPEPPTNCACVCRNMWSSALCLVCHERYNATADCGRCSPSYYIYSRCDAGRFVSGNWSLAFASGVDITATLRLRFLDAVAADMTRFLTNTSRCAAFNLTAYAMAFDRASGAVAFDVDVLDPEPVVADAAAACVAAAVAAVAAVPAAAMVNTTALLGADSVTLRNATALPAAAENPCGEAWCHNGAPWPTPLEDSPAASWPAAVGAAAAVAVVAGIAAAAVVYWRRRAGFHRGDGWAERPLGKDEVEWCEAEMDDQALIDQALPAKAAHATVDADDEGATAARIGARRNVGGRFQ